MIKNGHIFISYRSIEAHFALQLAADLKNAGVNIWMDRLDTGLKIGDDWVQALQDALDTCAGVIAVLSPDYVTSKYCRRELKRADTNGKPIFPILSEKLAKKEWPFEIQEKQYIDFSAWRDGNAYQLKLGDLIGFLKRRSPGQIVAKPDKETQFLTRMVAALEARKGVLEYVELSGTVDTPNEVRPRPQEDEWASGFSQLLKPDSESVDSPTAETKRIPLRSVQEAVEKHHSFVLLGAPGAGKTTTLCKLALDTARERLRNPRTAPLPLLLNLSMWQEHQEPREFVRDQWPFDASVTDALDSGDVHLYLDGLNEMGATGPEHAQQLKAWLRGKDSPRHVFVTCRKDDYGETLELDLPMVLVEELDETRIRQFALNYLKNRAENFLAAIIPTDEREWSYTRHLFELARNPYLLAALVYVYDKTPDGVLPHNNGALFQGFVSALWERERQRQTPGWIPFADMEAALARLAFAMVDEDRPTDVSRGYALKHLGKQEKEPDKRPTWRKRLWEGREFGKNSGWGDTLLYLGDRANLVSEHDGSVRFYHQLMQEYFAGVALLGDRQKVTTLVNDQKWKQAIISWSGLVPPADDVLELLGMWEAADFIGRGFNASDEYRDKLAYRLATADLGATNHHDYEPAIKGLIQLGKASVPTLLKFLASTDELERARAAHVLGRIGDPDTVSSLRKCLRDEDGEVRYRATLALGHIGPQAKEATPDLIEALNDERSKVRQAAVEALVKVGADAKEVVDFSGADLRGADLRGADLRGVDLRGADLRGVDLRGADLRGAGLSYANLRGAYLSYANLSDARGVTEEQLEEQAKTLEGATMLNGQKYEDWLKDKKAPGSS